jgi:hypothetical protein
MAGRILLIDDHDMQVLKSLQFQLISSSGSRIPPWLRAKTTQAMRVLNHNASGTTAETPLPLQFILTALVSFMLKA